MLKLLITGFLSITSIIATEIPANTLNVSVKFEGTELNNLPANSYVMIFHNTSSRNMLPYVSASPDSNQHCTLSRAFKQTVPIKIRDNMFKVLVKIGEVLYSNSQWVDVLEDEPTNILVTIGSDYATAITYITATELGLKKIKDSTKHMSPKALHRTQTDTTMPLPSILTPQLYA